MSILDDQPLERPSDEEPVPPLPSADRSGTRRIVIAVVVVALIVAAGFLARRWLSPRTASDLQPGAANAVLPPSSPDASVPEVQLPPRDQMDPFIRELLAALATGPEVARWLTTDDLTGHISMAIDQIARGFSPARDMKVLAPSAPFSTATRDGQRYIAPESYRRYDGIAAAVGSIDAQGAASAYRTIRPRLVEAYSLVSRTGDLDTALKNAIVTLLETPVVDGRIELVPGRGNLWAYADPALEALPSAQKQLLRMGPDNTRAIQQKLREIAAALGIEGLPVARDSVR